MNGLSPDRWVALWEDAGASGDPFPWYQRLVCAYTEPNRHYHNQQHVAECLAEFDGARRLAQKTDAVELALWFHDVIYDPRAGDNEEKSAALANRCLVEAKVEPGLAGIVSGLVMATKTHSIDADPDAAVMIDVDLSILGQPEERFWEYEAQIRQEYAWVPISLFGSKRANILEQFLARQRIYASDWFHGKYEQTARRNLAMSISKLRSSGV